MEKMDESHDKKQCYMSFEHSLSVILEFLYALSDITQGPEKRQFSKNLKLCKRKFSIRMIILFNIYFIFHLPMR